MGTLRLSASAIGLVSISWPNAGTNPALPVGYAGCGGVEHLREAEQQLRGYFAGERRRFELALDPRGTVFQKAVWAALLAIPYGETRSYREIAAAIGRPAAVRAVGAANGRNPLPIVTPCHRVVGTGGALTGFAGGLEAKRILLALEGCGTGRLI